VKAVVGTLSRGLQVRVLPGAPFFGPDAYNALRDGSSAVKWRVFAEKVLILAAKHSK